MLGDLAQCYNQLLYIIDEVYRVTGTTVWDDKIYGQYLWNDIWQNLSLYIYTVNLLLILHVHHFRSLNGELTHGKINDCLGSSLVYCEHFKNTTCEYVAQVKDSRTLQLSVPVTGQLAVSYKWPPQARRSASATTPRALTNQEHSGQKHKHQLSESYKPSVLLQINYSQ